MKAKRIRNDSINACAKILEAMQQGQTFTYRQACDLLGIGHGGANNRHINRLHADQLIHIKEWVMLCACRPSPVFAIGHHPDAPKIKTTRPRRKASTKPLSGNPLIINNIIIAADSPISTTAITAILSDQTGKKQDRRYIADILRRLAEQGHIKRAGMGKSDQGHTVAQYVHKGYIATASTPSAATAAPVTETQAAAPSDKFEIYPSGTAIEQIAPNVRRVDFLRTRRKSELSSNAHSYSGKSSLCVQHNIA